jgi:hypothetical protein
VPQILVTASLNQAGSMWQRETLRTRLSPAASSGLQIGTMADLIDLSSLSSGLIVRGGIRRADQKSRLLPCRGNTVTALVEGQEWHNADPLNADRCPLGGLGPCAMPDEAAEASRQAAPVADHKGHRRNAPRRSGASGSAALSANVALRLDAHRHLCLRLLSAIERRSGQRLLLEALDRFLSETTGLDQYGTTQAAQGPSAPSASQVVTP